MGSRERKIAIRIDPAIERDVPAVLRLIKGLAEYERLTHKVVATETGLHAALFGPRPVAEAVLARVSAEPVGFAVFFPTFSTFAGRPNMYLEDLYVELPWRRKGRRAQADRARCTHRRGARLESDELVGARLERAGARLLPQSGCGAGDGVGGIPHRRRGVQPARADE